MTTPRTRAIVSLLAASAVTLSLGACAHATSNAPAPAPERPATIRFDNEAQVYADVYLVGEQREWRLGRVQPGASTTFKLPPASLADGAGFVRLAVLANAAPTVRAARDPRATLTIGQPPSMLLTQRWTYSQRQLTAPEIFGLRNDFPRRR